MVLGQWWTEGYLSDWSWVSREQRRIIRTSTEVEEYCSVLVEQVLGIYNVLCGINKTGIKAVVEYCPV